jgi:hypothetical protein
VQIFYEPLGFVTDLRLQVDGKLVLFGYDYIEPTDTDFSVLRLSSDGVLDVTFFE